MTIDRAAAAALYKVRSLGSIEPLAAEAAQAPNLSIDPNTSSVVHKLDRSITKHINTQQHINQPNTTTHNQASSLNKIQIPNKREK